MDGSVDGDDIFPCKGCGEVRTKLPEILQPFFFPLTGIPLRFLKRGKPLN